MNQISRKIGSALQQTLMSVWDFISRVVKLGYQEDCGPVLIIHDSTGEKLAVISVMTVARLLWDMFSARRGEQQVALIHTAV